MLGHVDLDVGVLRAFRRRAGRVVATRPGPRGRLPRCAVRRVACSRTGPGPRPGRARPAGTPPSRAVARCSAAPRAATGVSPTARARAPPRRHRPTAGRRRRRRRSSRRSDPVGSSSRAARGRATCGRTSTGPPTRTAGRAARRRRAADRARGARSGTQRPPDPPRWRWRAPRVADRCPDRAAGPAGVARASRPRPGPLRRRLRSRRRLRRPWGRRDAGASSGWGGRSASLHFRSLFAFVKRRGTGRRSGGSRHPRRGRPGISPRPSPRGPAARRRSGGARAGRRRRAASRR